MTKERISAVDKPRDTFLNEVADQARILFEVDLPLASLACQRRDCEDSIERSGMLYDSPIFGSLLNKAGRAVWIERKFPMPWLSRHVPKCFFIHLVAPSRFVRNLEISVLSYDCLALH